MKKIGTKAIVMMLAAALFLSMGASAAVPPQLDGFLRDTAEYILGTVQKPQVGTIGGDWVILGLARSGCDVPEAYYQAYYTAVEQDAAASHGMLHETKYTEHARVVIALTAIGKDARSVAGYDLTKPLGDYDKTLRQGINGPVWALIALDSAGYPVPEAPEGAVQATRQLYVDYILGCQLADGGWALGASASASDPDVTGMVLQALAKYQNQTQVKAAIGRALDCLSQLQNGDGGYDSWGQVNSESVVQVLVALTELQIPLDDARFVKNGHTVLDNLLAYRQEDGSFRHTWGEGGPSQLATEQGLYGMAAALRAQKGASSLYRMDDAIEIPDAVPAAGGGLADKHPDVTRRAVTNPGADFADIADSPAADAIRTLAARGIITGKSGGGYDPDGAMTRAEYAAIVVKALGLTPQGRGVFSDVAADGWYAPYADTAYAYGIVSGAGNGTFSPDGPITRQEAAVMTARCAKLCGLDTAMEKAAIPDVISQFLDYKQSAEWAQAALAFCYQENILDQSDMEIRPEFPATRGEVAQMLCQMLELARLL